MSHYYVTAEAAPIGVQLWPTRRPDQAPAFTLEEVRLIRRELGDHVEWVYRNGSVRAFKLGEQVVCADTTTARELLYGPAGPIVEPA